MFTEALKELQNNKMPDTGALVKRFDFAITKKLGILKLPPPLWMQDPKINPPAAHLFWAALLLKDRNRIDQALSVIAIERDQMNSRGENDSSQSADERARELLSEFLDQFTDTQVRKDFEQDLTNIVPEWLTCKMDEGSE